MAEIVNIERRGEVVELVVRRGDDVSRYGFTEVPASVVPVNGKGGPFHRDFPGPEDLNARIMMFAVAWQVFRGVAVRLPYGLP
jgi:hypothetical protein